MSLVCIVGASADPTRYSHQAQLRLLAAGHELVLVTPRAETILGLPCYPDLAAVHAAGLQPTIITLYVNPMHLRPMLDDLLALSPTVVIANPGTEDAELAALIEAADIKLIPACTLVMLSTQTFPGSSA